MKTGISTLFTLLILLPICPVANADEIDELLEKARTTGGKYERIRKIINTEPDQNVRLAAFDLMINHEDRNMKAIAIDAGLASTDRILQAAAFKAAIFDLESIHLVLGTGDNGSRKPSEYANKYLAANGNSYVMNLGKKDIEFGTFGVGNGKGEISGMHLTYTESRWAIKSTFTLKDDDAIEGVFEIQGYKFNATGKLR